MSENSFGAKLRELRKNARLSQRELAERVGVNFSYLSKIESGAMPPPSEQVIEKLADALGADKDELLLLAGKIPSDIARILMNKKTLQMLRSAKIKRKLGETPERKKERVGSMSGFNWYKTLSKAAIPIVLVAAMAVSLWFAAPQPAKALQVAFPTLPSGSVGTTHSFSITVDLLGGELVPIQAINLEIFNVNSPTVYKATANALPLNQSGTMNYSNTDTGNAGTISVTSSSPDGKWAWVSGTTYAIWQGTTYTFASTNGYGYAFGPTRLTYSGTWVSPASWPAGTYQAKVTVITTTSAPANSNFVTTSSSFSLAAAITSGGGGSPGITTLSTVVNSQGVFQSTVTAKSADNNVTVNIPSGTTGKTKEGTPLTALSVTTMASPPAPPAQANIIGLTYDFGPEGATFSPPITVSITYDPSKIPSGVAEKDLKIAYFDSAQNKWVELTDIVVDPVSHTISGKTTHFTPFTVLGFVPRPATFTVGNLTITPATVESGKSVTISAQISNTGDLSGAYLVTLKINNVAETTSNITLAAGAKQLATFVVTKTTVGTYTVDVNGLPGSFTVKAAAVQPKPASFTIGVLKVTPDEVEIGQSVTISAQVTNTGDASGTYQVVLKINNAAEATKEVTLAGGAGGTVTFTTSKTAAGSYDVNVNGLPGKFTVKTAPPVTPPTPPVTEEPKGGLPTWAWTLIAIGILVIILIIYLWRRNRY